MNGCPNSTIRYCLPLDLSRLGLLILACDIFKVAKEKCVGTALIARGQHQNAYYKNSLS